MCSIGISLVGALFGGYMQAKSQQDAYNAQAEQAEYNAKIANYNADVQESNAKNSLSEAETDAQADAMNMEAQHRKNVLMQGTARADIGGSGLMASGSLLDVYGDLGFSQKSDEATELYNNSQKVASKYNEANNYDQYAAGYKSQADNYNQQASSYRDAASNAFRNGMLSTGMTMATSLYSANSVGAKEASGVASTDSASNVFGKDANGNYYGSPLSGGWGNY